MFLKNRFRLISPLVTRLSSSSLKRILATGSMSSGSGDGEYGDLKTAFKQLSQSVKENARYFSNNTNKTSSGGAGHTDFERTFHIIVSILGPLETTLERITQNCHKFDISPTCKGNGYRSIVNIVESCLSRIQTLSQQIRHDREKFFFRSYRTYMQLDSYSQVLMRLLTIVQYAIILMEESDEGCLFPRDDKIDQTVMIDFERINRQCFYGRSFGFQYADSLQQTLQFVGVVMAAYGDGFTRHQHPVSRAISSMIHSGKYVVDPELRAKRITELTQHSDINFCKAFWSLTEENGAQHAPLLICPAMSINSVFDIPNDPITMTTEKNESIEIELPSLNGKVTCVKARLISYVWREGQTQANTSSYRMSPLGLKPAVRSRYLMLHAHGGGFVAQSSKSHEIYLRYWAKSLNIPILSIDYSLAPEAPFPQALNEIYFAYAWALNNFDKLGSTGEKIIFAGDSAGANLVTAACLKCIDTGLRLPDALTLAYPPMRFQYVPSPSRILSLMDPLLPIGVLKTCIKAYTGQLEPKSRKRINSVFYGERNPYDVDIGEVDFTYNEFNLQHTRSFSEADLTRIQVQIPRTEDLDDSFYSDFPYSDASSADEQLSDTEQENNDTIDSVSMLNSLTTTFTNKFQTMTSSMTSYLYGADKGIERRADQMQSSRKNTNNSDTSDKEVCSNSNTGISKECNSSNTGKSKEQNNMQKTDKDPTDGAKQFAICSVCLYRREHCTCEHGMLRARAKHVSDRYRSSHHHRPRSSSCSGDGAPAKASNIHRTTSLTHVNNRDETDFNRKVAENENLHRSPLVNDDPGHTEDDILSIQRSMIDLHFAVDSVTATNETKLPRRHDNTSLPSPTCETYAFELGKNPYLSPYMSSDESLMQLPPVSIIACSLDPLFDDSVEFVRKLKSLDKSAELYVVDKLPHGFLNFQVFSDEAREACDLIIACVKKSLKMGMRTNDSSLDLVHFFQRNNKDGGGSGVV